MVYIICGFTWLYLSKPKADIIQFCKMIKNQFEVNIKHFRTDNRREFMNSTIETHFKSEDILRESLCVNSPKKNGLEERKIGHILATTRSLIFQAIKCLYIIELTLFL